MYAKKLIALISALMILLTGCQAAATQAPIAVATQASHQETRPSMPAQVYPTQAPAPREMPRPTYVPIPTQAPNYAPLQPIGGGVARPPVPQPVPQDNIFQDYGVNGFVDTRNDHLSTFALDVDTASYTVARRYLHDGNLPPYDSVRVEEFVNYFDQGYTPPSDAAFAIYADGAPSPFHRDGSYLLRFGIEGYEVSNSDRKPAALTFVIDISGSMNMENRLGLVKQSLQLLVDRLRWDDTVSIVVFGSDARIALDPAAGDQRNLILNTIYSLQTEGSTNAAAGLTLGYQVAMSSFKPNGINRVILCSDGVANVGLVDSDSIMEKVHGYVSEGVTLTTIGVGMGNFNDVLLEQLADKGDGFYAYVDTLEEARKVFVEDLVSTLQVIARDAKVQVDFNPDVVSAYRLIGYENRAIADQEFRNDSVDAGEIGAGHTVTALYAVQLRPGTEGRLATVQLRWQDPTTYEVHEINGNTNSWDLAKDFYHASLNYRLTVLVGQFAELLRQSPYAEPWTYATVSEFAQSLWNDFPENPDVQEFIDLCRIAMQIDSRYIRQ